METFRGVVYPAQTDAMGHMTVQYYVAAFDQAMWHLVAALGYDPAWRTDRHEGWADVHYVIDFVSELKAGDLYRVESSVGLVGRSSITTRHELFGPGQRLVAKIEMKSVYFDLMNRKSLQLPQEVKCEAERHLALCAH